MQIVYLMRASVVPQGRIPWENLHMSQPGIPRMTRRNLLRGAAAAAAAPAGELVRLPRRIRLGLLGLDGHYGEILDPLGRLPDVELVAVSDADAGNAKRVIETTGSRSARPYADYREMLDREQFDVVAVCNNNGERVEAILACAARKLHVIAEKPLAIHRKDLERVKRAVEHNGIRLSMLLPMRFSSPYLAIRKVVEQGEIGEVAQIAAQKSYKAGERPQWMKRRSTFGGTIPWIGIHMVDLMRWASGREFTEVASFQARIGDFSGIGEMENVTGSLFRLDNGGVALLRMDYLRPETAPSHGDDRLRLAGTRGVVEYQEPAGVTFLPAQGKPEVLRDLPAGQSVFMDFLESVYAGKPAALPLADIYRVSDIVLTAREAADENRMLRI